MKKRKILVITPQYPPDMGPSAPIYSALCEDLAILGYEVIVITSLPHYAESNPNNRNTPRQSFVNGVKVIRTSVLRLPRKILLFRFFYHLSINISFFFYSILQKNISVFLVDAPFLWSGLPLLFNAIISKIPYIYIIHDIYPDVLISLGVTNNIIIINLIDKIEKFFYRKAAFISVLSEAFSDNLIKKNVAIEKIKIIPPCLDTEFIKPLSKFNTLREDWGLDKKFVVLYAGNIGFSQDLEVLLTSAYLLQQNADVVFVIVGEGSREIEIKEKIEDWKLNNVQLHRFLPRESVPELYALADVSLILLKKEIMYESVPSKTFSIMSSGRPIIAFVHPTSEVGKIIDEAKCGLVINPGDHNGLIDALLKLKNDPDLCSYFGRSGRDYVVKHYSRVVASHKYAKLLESIQARAPQKPK
jgi:colanic acid biosynthesis glycosyl transferase WcaI